MRLRETQNISMEKINKYSTPSSAIQLSSSHKRSSSTVKQPSWAILKNSLKTLEKNLVNDVSVHYEVDRIGSDINKLKYEFDLVMKRREQDQYNKFELLKKIEELEQIVKAKLQTEEKPSNNKWQNVTNELELITNQPINNTYKNQCCFIKTDTDSLKDKYLKQNRKRTISMIPTEGNIVHSILDRDIPLKTGGKIESLSILPTQNIHDLIYAKENKYLDNNPTGSLLKNDVKCLVDENIENYKKDINDYKMNYNIQPFSETQRNDFKEKRYFDRSTYNEAVKPFEIIEKKNEVNERINKINNSNAIPINKLFGIRNHL